MSESASVSIRPPAQAAPVQSHERVQFVDILRGFAILGVLIANMYSFIGASYNPQELAGFDRVLVAATRVLVEAKFYSLFSLLFGWGMAVQMLRAEARGTRFVPVFLRRLFILLIFGTLQGFFIWTGDILATYALYGFLLLALRKTPEKVILVLMGLVLLLSIVMTVPGHTMDGVREWYETATDFMRSHTRYPESLYSNGAYKEVTRLRIQDTLNGHSYFIYTFGNIFGMFLLGLYIGKRRIFHDVREHLPLVRKVRWIGLAVGLVLNALYIYTLLTPDWAPAQYYRLITRGTRTIGAPALMLFYVGTIILLVQRERWRERLAPLGNVGRMALTNYLTHSVLLTPIFYGYGLGLYGEFGPLFGLVLSIIIYAGQIRLSAWWLERFPYGPMEWVWRVLTYGRLRPGAAPAAVKEREVDAAARPGTGWVRSHGTLITVWVLLLLWAGALGYWWTQLGDASTTPGELPRPVVQARATATARAVRATATPQPQGTPVTWPLQREPGVAVSSGDLWSVAMSFDEEMAYDHIVELASPAYEGRRAGTEGGYAAADYIAQLFAAYDLQPAGADGGYFQQFPLDYFVAPDEAPTLVVIDADGASHDNYEFRQDYGIVVGSYGGEGEAEAPVVWVNTCNHDDFDDVNVVGKIVLCRDGGGEDTLRNGIEHGVAGLLLWIDPAERPFDRVGRYQETWIPVSYPSFSVSPEVVEDLLRGSGLTLADLTVAFESVELPTRARLSASLEQREGVMGRNVLGVLPGADPEYADEVVVIGAHYDHMGRDPDGERCPPDGEAGSCQPVAGAYWPGANDNASGVAVMLEIARSWQEAGYVPDRTVLFGAWDAEEQGLWGAIHYVRQPRYPLTSTVAMLQLDMVGGSLRPEGDGVLMIDGSGPLANRLQDLAASLDVMTTIADHGHSDHVPFRQSGVPASSLIWDYEDDPYYHRPADLPETIVPEQLAAAGRLSSAALINLTSVEPYIRDLVIEREAALVSGSRHSSRQGDRLSDRERFLATSTIEQQAVDAFWWDDLFAHDVQDLTLAVGDVVSARDVATATLVLNYQQGDDMLRSLRGSARFRREDDGWRYAGLARAELTSSRFSLSYSPDRPRQAADVLWQAEALWDSIVSGDAALESVLASAEFPLSISLYPSADVLRLAVSPTLPPSAQAWVDGNGARLVARDDLTETEVFTATLTQLALAQTGLRESQAPWLWAGLPLVREATIEPLSAQRIHLPRLQVLFENDETTPLRQVPSQRQVATPTELDRWRAQAWAMTTHLLDRHGADAAGRLASALGSGLSVDEAFEQVTAASPEAFDVAWQEDWRGRLASAQQGIEALVNSRQAAVFAGDAAGYLATVDTEDGTLLEEEHRWFEDLSEHPVQSYQLEGTLLALTDEGALARFALAYQPVGGSPQRVTSEVRIIHRGDEWLYGGVPFEETASEHFVVRYPTGLAALAADLRLQLEEIAAREIGDLGISPDSPTEVKLYDQRGIFRSSVSLSAPNDLSVWTRPGQAIKVLADRDTDALDLRSSLAHAYAHYLLAGEMPGPDWLREGIAQVEQAWLAPQTGYLAARRLSKVQKAAEQGQLPPLAELPTLDQIEPEQSDLVYGAVRDVVQYLVAQHGQAALNEIVRLLGQGESLEDAFRAALGISLADFETAWQQSAARGHVPPQWVEDARSFDGEDALLHARELASPAYDGREAGTPGGEAAAQYVAERFAALGLQPAGDDGSYLQQFVFTRTLSTGVPRLRLSLDDGHALSDLVYGQDLREVMVGAAGGGLVSNRVVWVRDEDYSAMDLGGQIALRRVSGGSLTAEVRKAVEHGAGGLLMVTDVKGPELQRRTPLAVSELFTTTIPVLEMTLSSLDTLVKEAGYSMGDLNGSPPALPLRVQAEIEVPLEPPQPVTTANVLGIIPGSDPDRAHQLVILGAHYDHVGRSPDGTLYPGADDNASGVGVLLEVARLWQEAGYQPARSVLFAAWGAEEFGQLGSWHYVSYPVLPLEDTIGVLNLDSLGAGRGFYLLLEADLTREALLRMHLDNAADLVDLRMNYDSPEDTSDQTPFQEQNLPAMLLTWDDSEDDANTPQDTPDRLDPLKLTKTGRIVTLALRTLAE